MHRRSPDMPSCNMFICCLLLCLQCSLSLAATRAAIPSDDTLRTLRLDSAVVKARRTLRQVSAPAPRPSLSAADIRQQAAMTLADALNSLPGVTMRDYGGAGGLKTVSVRGLGASHTAVSYDNIIMSNPQTGQSDLSRFSLAQTDSLTLTVGGESLMATPREAAAAATVRLQSNMNPHNLTQLEQGSYNHWSGACSMVRQAGKGWRWGLNGSYSYNANDYRYHLVNGLTNEKGRRTNSRMQALRGEANIQCITANQQLQGKFYYYDNNHHLPGVVIFYNPINHEKQHDREALAQLRWRTDRKAWTLATAACWSWQEARYQDVNGIYQGGRLAEDYWQREGSASVLLRYKPNGRWGLSYGTDYTYNALNSNQALSEHATRHSVLQRIAASYDFGLLSIDASLLGSTIINHAPDAEGARDFSRLSPQMAIRWRVIPGRQIYLRSFYKESYRAPSFAENYYYHIGNARLHPETSRQWGLGAAWQTTVAPSWPLLAVTADAYVNRVDRKIVSVPVSLHLWRTINMDRVDGRGLDIHLTSRHSLGARHQLTVQSSYSMQTVKGMTGRQLAYTPRHTVAASVASENPFVGMALGMTGTSERWTTHEHAQGTRLPGYAEMNFSIWRSIRLGRCIADIKADIHNMLAKQYCIIANYPMPEREYRLTIRLNW